MKTLSTIIQNKILLGILAAVTSIGGFLVWQHNKQEYEKFLADREEACKVDLSSGEVYVGRSRSLKLLRYNKIANPNLQKPGINSEFKKDEIYVLLKTKPDYLIPPTISNYETSFFKSLSTVHDYAPEPLLVTGISIDVPKRQALVSSSCSKTPFTVPLENLYATYQTSDTDNPLGFPNFLN
ncbi:hypothetical protein [Dendronalium sp. ChiSLP03b]|uniref:hypothetical protein n=1 Tax=Dendronalium sp. ChiSLP03b TaxID=3075381 RepID=UPI002AD5978E|nr:hypothetical protein [Dendronalium sp. ChiSLP03b]MDZ8208626.1 hypothetical protein [Dendronalium sp. ChiSLP03b]